MPSDAAYNREWRAKNSDKNNAYFREYRQKNLEKVREQRNQSAQRRRRENPEAVREIRKRHYQKWMAETPPEVRTARFRLRKYGLTQKQFDEMLIAQDFRCAICSKKTDLVVDHCHTNGHVRGLLCRECNNAIGLMFDSAENLLKASEYLLTDARKLGKR